MKLLIGSQPVALPSDATISLEKSSPALSDQDGSFSYPFAVPTAPNQRILGWPGRLERKGEVPDKSFVLLDQGVQVLRGEVAYDTVTRQEIGMILQSGATGFYAQVERSSESMLGDLHWGSEPWFSNQWVSWETFLARLSSWDQCNREENAPYLVAPFVLKTDSGATFLGNRHDAQGHLTQMAWQAGAENYYYYMLQFRAWWMISQIFSHFGYTVRVNELKESSFSSLVILTRPFGVSITQSDPDLNPEAERNTLSVFPPLENLEYAHLMPECSVKDFLVQMKTLMGLAYDIDDQKKEVRILLLKNILTSIGEVRELKELSSWQHREGSATSGGFTLGYTQQEDPRDTMTGYTVSSTVQTLSQLPEPSYEGLIIRVTSVGRDYITVRNTAGDPAYAEYYYRQIGRLQPFSAGSGGTTLEFNLRVPPCRTDMADLFSGPVMALSYSEPQHGMVLYDMKGIYASLYRGLVTNFVITTIPFQTVPIPFLCPDQWILTPMLSLTPQSIYQTAYAEYLTWRSSCGRSFTKYVRLTLSELMALNWGSRYVISGVQVILSRINYELPYRGVVKIEGFVV